MIAAGAEPLEKPNTVSTEFRAGIIGAIAGAFAAIVIGAGAIATGLVPAASNARIHDYLLSNPQILVELTNKLQQQQNDEDDSVRQKAVDKIGLKAYLNPRVAFVTGPANAKRTFVEFYDYDCPYCRASLPVVRKFYAAHKNDTRFAFIELPIASLHGPGAVLAAKASLAARRQPDKFVAFHFALMGEEDAITEDTIYADAGKAGLDVDKLKADMEDSSIDLAVAAAHALAAATHIDGTPAFIINGTIREGALDKDDLPKLESRT